METIAKLCKNTEDIPCHTAIAILSRVLYAATKATFTRDRVFRPGLDARRKMASSAHVYVFTQQKLKRGPERNICC